MDGPEADARPACGVCGTTIPPAARFCPGCATPVAGPGPLESRRTVTLLFTDVTGSTALGEELDPEACRSVMGRYFEVAEEAVTHHGGTVEKFVGDAVLAVFGIPEVHEDDAVRAVRAAHELNGRLADLSHELEQTLGVRLAVRTGVNTGAVVTGAARAGGSFATGDAVNTAARLEQAARPGEILIGAETYALVRDAVDAEAVEPVHAKGKATPVAAYRLLSVSDDSPGRKRRLSGPLLGRDRETHALGDAFERTVEHRRSHLVTVIGAAGLGKSRLVAEFLARVGDRADVASGRCFSYGEGITFWPVVQVLRQVLGVADDASDETVRATLDRALADAPDRPRLTDLLVPLLGGSGAPGGSDETAWAVRRVLEHHASRRPLVVTVDDLHWAEPALLTLLGQVHEEVADLPLLLVCQARPELLDEHPDWGRGSLNSTTFALEPLTREQVGAVLTSLLDGPADDAVIDAVVAWSGGNPLFVEEVTAHLVEAGLVASGPDGWVVSGDLSDTTVPPTVAALLAARLERLPAAERLMLERVSVIGLELTTDDALVLSSETAPEASALLSALSRRELLRRVRDASRETWAFRHIMIRDAAYSSLPKALRAALHETFADSIGSRPTAGAETSAFVAHHLHQAAGYRRELAPHATATATVVARAVDHLAAAAAHARDRDDARAALQLSQRAVDLGPRVGPRRRELLLRLIQAYNDMRVFGPEVVAVLELLETATDESASELDRMALRNEQLAHHVQVSDDFDLDEVEGVGRDLERLAREAGDNLRLRRALRIQANARAVAGQWKEVQQIASELAEVGGPWEARQRLDGEWAVLVYGPYAFADLYRELAPAWASVGTPRGEAESAFIEAICAAAAGRTDAHEMFDRAVALTRAAPGGLDSEAKASLSGICLVAGWEELALDWIRAAIEAYRAAGDHVHGSTVLGFEAILMLQLGQDPAEARRVVDEADEWTSPHDALSVALVAAARCLLASRQGDHGAAEDFARLALEAVDGTDQAWQQADLRRWVSEFARTSGDRETERLLLSEALDRYRIKQMTYYTSLIERRLAELR